MNQNLLIPVIAVALSLAVAGCNKSGKLNQKSEQPLPTGPVTLKMKWTPNERVVQDLDVKMKNETSMPGQTATTKQDITLGEKFAMTVLKEDADGGHEIEMEYLSARMGMEQGGKKLMDYDSEKKSADGQNNPVADIFGKVIGAKLHFFLDASNNVERVEGADELMARFTSGPNAAAAAPLQSLFSPEMFKQMMRSSQLLPTNAVSPGDSWPVQVEMPINSMGTLAMEYTVTLDRWEQHGKRNCARMEFQGTLKTKSGTTSTNAAMMGMSMAIQDGTTSGVSWFDPELGIVIDSNMHQDITMTITLPKNPRAKPGTPAQTQTVTNQMSQDLVVKLDSFN